jgi:hypothetical protein
VTIPARRLEPRPPAEETARVVITAAAEVLPEYRGNRHALLEAVRATLEATTIYQTAGTPAGALRDVSARAELVVLVLDQRHDSTVRLHLSDLGARAALVAYVREFWTAELGPGVAQPDDDQAAITTFFDSGEEGYLIVSAAVEP